MPYYIIIRCAVTTIHLPTAMIKHIVVKITNSKRRNDYGKGLMKVLDMKLLNNVLMN